MDPSTSEVIAGAGLLVAVLAMLAAWWGIRALRRRHQTQLELLGAAQARLEEQINLLAATRTLTDSVAPGPSADEADDAIVEAEIVGEDEESGPATSALVRAEAMPSPAEHGGATGRPSADRVAREALVRTVSLAHGIRHGLSGRTRNRIRYEMGREVKRSRRARKDEVKVAVREYRARQRDQQRTRMRDQGPSGENGP